MILLFLYAGISKFLEFDRFTGEMNNQPFPNTWTPFLVWTIPSIEIIIALALMFERTRLPGLMASFILMTLFTLYTSSVLLHFFAYVPCSCGGVIRKLSWPQHIIKWTLMTLAVALSIGGALATRLHQECQAATQYYYNGGYMLAGRLGIDYICNTPSSAICTYYKVGSTYIPCMWGNYRTSNCGGPIDLHKKAKN